MDPTRSLAVTIAGARAGQSPPTWGQSCIWQWHGRVADGRLRFNNSQHFDLPAEAGLDQVVAAIAQVVARHDALRTVLEVDGSRIGRQIVHGEGSFALDVYEADPGRVWDVVDEVSAAMVERPWSYADWPLRLAVVCAGRQPASLVVSHNRLVLDVQSVEVVRAEVVAAASAGTPGPAPVWEALDEAAYEQSEQGRALNAKALEHWSRALAGTPTSMFDFPPQEPEADRFMMAELESVAAARAVRLMRRRWRVAGGPVVLAALAVTLSRYSGHSDIVLQLFAGNRSDRNRRQLLGTLISEGPLPLSTSALSFADLARHAARITRDGHRSAFCDPESISALRAEQELRRGAHLDLAVYFNDMQTGQQEAESEPEPTEAEIRELAAYRAAGRWSTATGWTGWDESWQAQVTRKDIRLLLTVQHGPTLPLMLSCDTRYIPREAIAQLLGGMERVLVAAACGEPDVERLARLSGVAPVERPASWVRCEDGWADRRATDRLWRAVNGTPATVVGEAAPDHPGRERLVGYVGGAQQPAFDELHRRLLEAIGDRSDVRTPELYRWVATPAAGEPADWRSSPVLAEDDGRSAARLARA